MTTTAFKANWGEGYKAPSVSELYMDYTHMGVLTLGNPNLRPEESKNWDLSYEGEWGKTFGKITYFHNDIDNMISTRTVGGRHGYNEYYNIDGTTKTPRRRTDFGPQALAGPGCQSDQQLDQCQQ